MYQSKGTPSLVSSSPPVYLGFPLLAENRISRLLRVDWSRSLRSRAEENGGVYKFCGLTFGTGERNLGSESLEGSFCLRFELLLSDFSGTQYFR